MFMKKQFKKLKKKPIIGGILAILLVTTGWVFKQIIYSTFLIPLSQFSEYTQNWIVFIALILLLMLFGYKWNKIITK